MTTIADAGFGRLLVRDVSRGASTDRELVYEILRARSVAVGVVVALSAIRLAIAPSPVPIDVVLLGLAYLTLEATAYGFESAAVGAERPWRFVGAQSLAAVGLLLGVTIIAISDRATLTSAMAVLVGASTLKVCGHAAVWRRQAPSGDRQPRRSVRSLMRQAIPFLGLTLLATVYYRVGTMTLYAVRGAEETASYAAAFRIVDVVGIAASLVFAGVSPSLSRVHRDRPDQIWGIWVRMVSVAGVVVLPVAVIGFLVASPLCELLFGSVYRAPRARISDYSFRELR